MKLHLGHYTDWQQYSRASDERHSHTCLEVPGTEPGTFHMESRCSTTERQLYPFYGLYWQRNSTPLAPMQAACNGPGLSCMYCKAHVCQHCYCRVDASCSSITSHTLMLQLQLKLPACLSCARQIWLAQGCFWAEGRQEGGTGCVGGLEACQPREGVELGCGL